MTKPTFKPLPFFHLPSSRIVSAMSFASLVSSIHIQPSVVFNVLHIDVITIFLLTPAFAVPGCEQSPADIDRRRLRRRPSKAVLSACPDHSDSATNLSRLELEISGESPTGHSEGGNSPTPLGWA